MAQELAPIDITNTPDLVRLVEEVQTTRRPRRLRRGDEDVALLMPLAPAPPKRRTRGQVLTEQDPVFGLIGIGHSGGSGDVSANKHHYLAEAYRAERRVDRTL